MPHDSAPKSAVLAILCASLNTSPAEQMAMMDVQMQVKATDPRCCAGRQSAQACTLMEPANSSAEHMMQSTEG